MEEKTKIIFKSVQSPIGYVLNCFEKEVVLFLVFISFQEASVRHVVLCTKSVSNVTGNGPA